MAEVPWGVVGPLLAVVLAIDVMLLLDLRRHEVTGPPKVVWALVILFVSFPVGPLLYWFVGRRTDPSPDAVPPPPPPDASTRLAGLGDDPEPAPTWAPPGRVALATHRLRKVYDVAAVDGVELRVPRGATYGLIGPNGSGKTTLLSLVAGLRPATEGTVELPEGRHGMALLPDTPEFEPWLTAREVVDLARTMVAPDLPAERVDRALAEVGMADAADRRVGGFSRGMLQRLGLATCLVGDPQLLLLDEPSSALDPAGRREVLDLVARLAGERTVVLSTHVLSDVQQACDVVGVLQAGQLRFQGPIEELLARTATTYRLRVGGDLAAVVAGLRAAPWTDEVVEEGHGVLRLAVADVAAAEAGVARVLADAGARLHAFGPAADLETAFLTLTGGDA